MNTTKEHRREGRMADNEKGNANEKQTLAFKDRMLKHPKARD